MSRCHNCGVPEEQFKLEQEFSEGLTIEEFNERAGDKSFCSTGCAISLIEKSRLY